MADMGMDDRLDAAMDAFNGTTLPGSVLADADAIARLARMDAMAYSRVRKAEANALNVTVAVLDNEVRAHQRMMRMDSTAGAAKPWMRFCQTTQQGEVRSNLANVMLPLRIDPRVSQIARYDEMQRLVILTQPIPGTQIDAMEDLPRPIRDADYTHIQEWIQKEGLEAVAPGTVRQAVDARAIELGFHPIRNWLDSIEWDGKPRLGDWLTRYLGVVETPYTNGIGALFLISMAARVRQPGCKCDYALVLEGPQGGRKSTACAILGGAFYSDSLPDIRGGKDVSQHLNGKWVIEVAELSALDKAGAAALKAFITRPVERYRPSYGHAEVVEPRQCVFIGTTNKTAYLRDETGGRRFWPVTVGKIDTDALARDREQLLAEADAKLSEGAAWWPDAQFEAEHIVAEQSARYEADAWEDAICDWLDGLQDNPASVVWQERPLTTPQCTVLMVARLALHIDAHRVGTTDQRRIIAAMERLGWEKAKRTMTGQPYKPGVQALARKDERDCRREKACSM